MKQQDRFASALTSISRRVSKLHATEICCGDLTREQFLTLRTIEAAREAAGGESRAPSVSALSASLGVDVSTMSRNISVLEREKYVARSRSVEDSRIVTVVLTPKGRHALATLRCDEQDVMAKVFRRLPTGARASIVEALETVQAALDAGAEVAGDACCAPGEPSRATR